MLLKFINLSFFFQKPIFYDVMIWLFHGGEFILIVIIILILFFLSLSYFFIAS